MNNSDLAEIGIGITERLERIATSLELIASAVDSTRAKHFIRMSDVDRAKVYSTHLGEKLSKPAALSSHDPAISEAEAIRKAFLDHLGEKMPPELLRFTDARLAEIRRLLKGGA